MGTVGTTAAHVKSAQAHAGALSVSTEPTCQTYASHILTFGTTATHHKARGASTQLHADYMAPTRQHELGHTDQECNYLPWKM